MPAKCLCNIVNRAQAFLYVCTGTHASYQCRKTCLQGIEHELGHPFSHGFVNLVTCLFLNVIERMSNKTPSLKHQGTILYFALNLFSGCFFVPPLHHPHLALQVITYVGRTLPHHGQSLHPLGSG